MIAKRAGLGARSFIAACNANNVVPKYLETGQYIPEPSKRTLSNAMDVGDPSNLARIRQLFNDDLDLIRENMATASISDEETAATIRKVHAEFGYTMDPHTAVGFASLEKLAKSGPSEIGVVLATAHPVKFDSVSDILSNNIDVPTQLQGLATGNGEH